VQFYKVCADTVKAKQSTAEYGRRLCLFWPSHKLTFDLTLKVVSESHVTWATSSLPMPLCSRLRPNVRDRQTSDRQTSGMVWYGILEFNVALDTI